MRPGRGLGLLVLAAALAGCERADQERPAPPATVAGARLEADLATVALRPDAVSRLGIQTAPVDRRPVPRTRTLGGEVLVPARRPDGSALALRALPAAADRARGAEALALAEGDVARGRVELKAATTAAARARRMLRDGTGSARDAEEAASRLETARATLDAAERHRDVLVDLTSGAPNVVWVRVPVYVGDLDGIARQRSVRVGSLAGRPGDPTREASPADGPPSADPDTATVDLFYEVDNADGAFVPGQKVAVTLPLAGERTSLVVPWSAVLHDEHGGTWVYEETGPCTYARRRVAVRTVSGDTAVLARGPAPGARIVTMGAAELFGTEFGATE